MTHVLTQALLFPDDLDTIFPGSFHPETLTAQPGTVSIGRQTDPSSPSSIAREEEMDYLG